MAQRLQFRRGTAALATSNNAVLGDGELGYETDTRKIKIGDGVTAWNDLQYTAVLATEFSNYPVGYVYWQFPGKSSPIDMSLPGTWVNISSDFAGDFFRAEGGNASAFESGEQGDQNKSHNHTQVAHRHTVGTSSLSSGVYGACVGRGHPNMKGGLAGGESSTSYATQYDLTDRVGQYLIGTATPTINSDGGTESRPVNRTIRLWERTA
jgi:hypothetical protein